jgi:hypothetical protein
LPRVFCAVYGKEQGAAMITGWRAKLVSGAVGVISVGAVVGATVLFRGALRVGGPVAARPKATSSAALSQSQAEQQAMLYLQQNSPGVVTKSDIQQVTLGQLNGPPACSGAEFLFRAALFAMEGDGYNPCNPDTLLWVMNFEGEFDFGRGMTGDSAEVVILADGEFLRAGGTITSPFVPHDP